MLSVVALAVYWPYIKKNIPLDHHCTTSNGGHLAMTSSDTDTAGGNDDGNNNYDIIIDQPWHSLDSTSQSTYQLDSGVNTESCVIHI